MWHFEEKLWIGKAGRLTRLASGEGGGKRSDWVERLDALQKRPVCGGRQRSSWLKPRGWQMHRRGWPDQRGLSGEALDWSLGEEVERT